MANGQTSNEPMLCLTMCAYKREGMDDEDYRKYMTEHHVPLVRDLMVKHGIDKYSMTHSPPPTRALMNKIFDAQFANVADYDCIVQIQFRDIDQFIALKADPEYKRALFADHEKFADTKRTRMTIGYVRDFLRDGMLV
ncbi:EthD domain-containing protein [Xylaria bambusicola]|uniref:EthD domain-containing protein n=1 Tax=Xylaria bambusicola TaxID=326684 RepID=UPI0020084486|nr:EthD domain-containing protein [Xylaria bambusicola]KAI0517870.1 EthD domain-containing protein [Xylaria bambusicola]